MPRCRVRPPADAAGFDPSRAAQRAADPRGWRYDDARRQAVYDVIAERRDVRRFRPDAVDDDVLERVLDAAHRAPSVGLMQPWRLIVIRSLETRSAVRALAQRERLRQADRFDERARQFLDQKIEGVVEAPARGLRLLRPRRRPARRSSAAARSPTPTSTAPPARSRTCGWPRAPRGSASAGSASTGPRTCARCSGCPTRVDPIAYLCLGWPDERPVRPALEAAGWSARLPLDAVVMHERWRERGGRGVADQPRRRCRALGARSPVDRRRRSRRATGSTSSSSPPAASARSSR